MSRETDPRYKFAGWILSYNARKWHSIRHVRAYDEIIEISYIENGGRMRSFWTTNAYIIERLKFS